MRALIKKSFPYGADGLTAVQLAAGTIHDIRDDLFRGLKDEGWIDCAPAAEGVSPAPPPGAGDTSIADLAAVEASAAAPAGQVAVPQRPGKPKRRG